MSPAARDETLTVSLYSSVTQMAAAEEIGRGFAWRFGWQIREERVKWGKGRTSTRNGLAEPEKGL